MHRLSDDNMLCITIFFFPALEKRENTRRPDINDVAVFLFFVFVRVPSSELFVTSHAVKDGHTPEGEVLQDQ